MDARNLIDRWMLGRLSRRELGRAMTAAGVALVAHPVFVKPVRAAEEVSVFTWSGYELPEFHPAYTEKYGGGPTFAFFGAEEEALQKMMAGFTPDLMHPCTYSVPRWRDAGQLKTIDTSRLAHWDDLFPNLKSIPGALIDGETYLAPYDWGNSSVIARVDKLKGDKYINEHSWAILYDEDYDQQLAMFDSETAAVAVPAMVLGYENPWTMDDDQLAEVRMLMQKQRSLLRFYWSSQTEVVNAIAAGELAAAYAWNEAMVELTRQGIEAIYMNPKEGIWTWVCGLALHANGPGDEQAAYDFIDAMLAPESGAYLIDQYGYGHSNQKSFEMVEQDRLVQLGISTPQELISRSVFIEEVPNPYKDKYIQLLEEVKAGM
jgi:spermidine/putrescine transport system substrate-binding protein